MKHSNVFYVYVKTGEKAGFEAVKKVKVCKNDFGLDLFIHDGSVYEGRTGCRFINENELPQLADKVQKMGGIEGFNKRVEDLLKQTGDSPRYTRPDERKRDIFPPREKDENIVFAKDVYGKKHYYFRFYNEKGIELYTLQNDNDSGRRIHIKCEGYMVDIGSHYNLEERLEWLAGLDGGLKGEIESLFNESVSNPNSWADIGFANILGRIEEAKAHNAPIREAREQENRRRDEERIAKRVAEEQVAEEEYRQAIKKAETCIINKQTVLNDIIHGKSLIMQLFRELGIAVPLKTQGWIINALHNVYFNEKRNYWSYQYYNKSRDSTVFSDYLSLLVSAIQAKYQSDKPTQKTNCETPHDSHTDIEHAKNYKRIKNGGGN